VADKNNVVSNVVARRQQTAVRSKALPQAVESAQSSRKLAKNKLTHVEKKLDSAI